MGKEKGKGYSPLTRKARRTLDIAFDADHEFHGAEVTVALTASLDFVVDVQTLGTAGIARQREIIREFGDLCLVSWNIEDRHGNPVAADGDGLVAQDMEFVKALLEAWAEVVTQPAAPLGETSNGGGTSEAA